MLPSKRFIKIVLILLVIAVGFFFTQKYVQEKQVRSAIISVQKNIPFFPFKEPTGDLIPPPDGTDNTPKPNNQNSTQKTWTPSPSEEIDRTPVIDRLSSTVFGNGDTITIFGKHFTDSNTVLLSIEFNGTFTGIPSPDGKTITFTANLSVSKKVQEGIDHLDPETKKVVLEKIIAVASKDSPYKDGWYVPATIGVKTDSGLSNIIPVSVNVTKGI